MSNNDPSVRRLLPQNTPVGAGSFSTFAPQQQYQQRETQKNYVFVDEHNRHKRLKVMRACEGCRRRKIKCDAATTNTWPCSACIRLKLQCVRPNGQYEDSFEPASSFSDNQLEEAFRQAQIPLQQSQMLAGGASKPTPTVAAPAPNMYASPTAYAESQNVFSSVGYPDSAAQHNLHYTTVPPPVSLMGQQYAAQGVFPTPPLHTGSRADSSPEAYSQDSEYQAQDLAELLGGLRVNEAGTAPYLRNKASFRHEEEPAIEDADEFKSVLPPIVPGPGLKIRIPPELMPDDETVLQYFDLYFTHVHPYVPVLSKGLFYQQWNTNRESISPLILESIFAIAGRLADEPAQGQQWLALATKHADSFMDVPRLSTLQAMLLILKAREAAPKRGYYFRSWMTVVQCVQMGIELGLDEHFAEHKAGHGCDSSPIECRLKTRIWQTLFVCEVMIGSPQGRTDLAIDVDSVDLTIPRPLPGEDESEYQVSRSFAYFNRLVANVSRMNTVYARIKKRKEWGIDPEFIQLNPSINAWLDDLPADMQVSFPDDGSPPWLSSPFVGNLHSYYYLTLILLHRPQLTFLDPNGADGQWRQNMLICTQSARSLCRLQEAVLNTYGLSGMQSMQRGFSFTVYCGLSCIVLHLVAITSPDPEFNSDAREYFTRHMRLLEHVMNVWPMADLKRQIDAVREAFSADTRKAFVLKPSFPYGSPQSSNHSSPPRSTNPSAFRPSPPHRTASFDHPGSASSQHRLHPHHLDTSGAAAHSQVSYTSHPISPPISAGPGDLKGDPSSPALQSQMVSMMSSSASMGSTMTLVDPPTWNPQRIFEQWNTSFGAPQVQQQQSASLSPQGSSLSVAPSSTGAPEVPTLQDLQGATVVSLSPAGTQPLAGTAQQQFAAAPVQAFVTPAMWQESVASVYEGGLKRAWDYDGGPILKHHR